MAGAVLLAVIATGLGIVVPRPFFVSPGDRPQSVVSDTGSMTGPRTVLLLSNAIHTDIALPASPASTSESMPSGTPETRIRPGFDIILSFIFNLLIWFS